MKRAFAEADHVLKGEVRIGGQEHFYLETNATIAIPREEDELEVFCSTQHPSEIQKLIAHVLNIHINRVNVRVKRIGGGFGGKESRAALLAVPVAFAAHKYAYVDLQAVFYFLRRMQIKIFKEILYL